MKKVHTIILFTILMVIACCGCGNRPQKADRVMLAENDSVAILCQVFEAPRDEHDIPTVAIWIREKGSRQEKKLYQTVKHGCYRWYISDGEVFCPVSLDSILVTEKVTVYNDKPLQLIVEGCPDLRNVFSYFIDVENNKAWKIPSNQGYVGTTSEEGYMVFQSYRYVKDPDVAGRYTFLQIFDDEGKMVDSLNLEHLHLPAIPR